MNINFKNKNILITGAGNGLGFFLLERFYKEGANIIAIDNNQIYLNKLKKKYYKEINKKIFLYNLDLSNPVLIKKFSKICNKKFSKIYSFIFCAKTKLKNNKTITGWDDILNVSVKSPMLFIENLKSKIIKSQSSVINIGSTNSFYISHQPLAYHVAKSGLNQLTKYYANNLGKYNARFNVVEPGLIKSKKINKKISNINKILIPLKKPAEYNEICDLILYLSSEKSSYITGATIRIDGGITTSDHPNLVNKIIKLKKKI